MQCRAHKTNVQEDNYLNTDLRKLLWIIGFVCYGVSGYLTQMMAPYSGLAWSGVVVFGTLLVVSYIRWGELHESI